MIGLIVLSFLISAVAFKDKPPLARSAHTVGTAVALQAFLSVVYHFMMRNFLQSKGYAVERPDLSEVLLKWVISTPIAALIIGAFLLWRYKKSWIEDDESFLDRH